MVSIQSIALMSVIALSGCKAAETTTRSSANSGTAANSAPYSHERTVSSMDTVRVVDVGNPADMDNSDEAKVWKLILAASPIPGVQSLILNVNTLRAYVQPDACDDPSEGWGNIVKHSVDLSETKAINLLVADTERSLRVSAKFPGASLKSLKVVLDPNAPGYVVEEGGRQLPLQIAHRKEGETFEENDRNPSLIVAFASPTLGCEAMRSRDDNPFAGRLEVDLETNLRKLGDGGDQGYELDQKHKHFSP